MSARSNSEKADLLEQKVKGLSESLGVSDEMLEESEKILEQAEETSQETSLSEITPEDPDYKQVVSLSVMSEDFKFVRDTLMETTQNAKRIQNLVTLDLLDLSGTDRTELITSFTEISKTINDAQKLYVQAYREMSNTLLNLEKIKEAREPKGPSTVHNTLNIGKEEDISTADLIKSLRK